MIIFSYKHDDTRSRIQKTKYQEVSQTEDNQGGKVCLGPRAVLAAARRLRERALRPAATEPFLFRFLPDPGLCPGRPALVRRIRPNHRSKRQGPQREPAPHSSGHGASDCRPSPLRTPALWTRARGGAVTAGRQPARGLTSHGHLAPTHSHAPGCGPPGKAKRSVPAPAPREAT